MIGGIILAAGMSIRMGRPKMALPWQGGRTVLGQMVHVLRTGGVDLVIVVTGSDREAIQRGAGGLEVTFVHNAEYATSGMFSSVRKGLHALEPTDVEAALITPGDLPTILPATIKALIDEWRETSAEIIAPSYEGRRGHPVLVAKTAWGSLRALPDGATLRDFFQQERGKLRHVIVDDPGILRDLDTPEDYRQARAEAS